MEIVCMILGWAMIMGFAGMVILPIVPHLQLKIDKFEPKCVLETVREG